MRNFAILALFFFLVSAVWARPQEVGQMPDLRGLTEKEARRVLGRQGGFQVQTLRVSSESPQGRIVGFSPTEGATLWENSRVVFHISSGRALVGKMPEEVGVEKEPSNLLSWLLFGLLQLLAVSIVYLTVQRGRTTM